MPAMEILLVEDNPADLRLVREALGEARVQADLCRAATAEQALALLRERAGAAGAALPDLVLLDLNLPGQHGRELLAEIKGDPALRTVPVVVLTTSAARADVLAAYGAHANAYMVKPDDYAGYVALVAAIGAYWLGAVLLPTRAA